jgi:orotidine-5'-phosphate decarboxylase
LQCETLGICIRESRPILAAGDPKAAAQAIIEEIAQQTAKEA